MIRILKIIKHFIFIVFLTVLSQIGGLAYILNLFFDKKRKTKNGLKSVVTFTIIYSIITFIVVPFVAPFFGREKVVHTDGISPTNYMTIVLNRNYVVPSLNKVLVATKKDLKGTGIQIHYLDANFPFIIGFPLLPHLSHNDGKKLDLSLIYQTQEGKISDKQKSRSGYGIFVGSNSNEIDQANLCKDQGFVQYDYSKYLTFGATNKALEFSQLGTKKLVQSLLKNQNIEKMFIEPHLKNRMNLKHAKIRYHGCHSVRHDDHIHIQIK